MSLGGGVSVESAPLDSKLQKLLDEAPENTTIRESIVKTYTTINNPKYKRIGVSVSGGADSDVMMDLIERCNNGKAITYFWFDTGLEYNATKEHLKYLENRYNVPIERVKAVKPIPLSCKEYGQPFLSKFVSEEIRSLQHNNFKWEDRPYEELKEEYPKCGNAIRWWCDYHTKENFTTPSQWAIGRNRFLKEFLIENPPTFKISNRCCIYAKKKPAHKFSKENQMDMECIGIRRAEGGMRNVKYKSCFVSSGYGYDEFLPIFWYTSKDREEYEEHYNIIHSKCYTEYGLTRTGCCGCPYNRNLVSDLAVIQTYEPKLMKAVSHVFEDSYAYTKKYREFVKKKKEELKNETAKRN